MSEPIALKVSAAAKLIGISRFPLYDAINAGELPFTKLHPKGDTLILLSDLKEWLLRNRQRRTTAP